MESICNLKDIYKVLYQFEKEFSEAHQITINEGMVLCCMKNNEPRTANELCEFIGLSNSRVSRVISTVEAKELINRSIGERDKRLMVFTLTEKGEKKLKQISEHAIDFCSLRTKILELIK